MSDEYTLFDKKIEAIENLDLSKAKKPYFSNSRIDTISLCALKYRFQYVEGLRIDVPGYATSLGGAVHNTLEWVFKTIWAKDEYELPERDEVANKFLSIWGEVNLALRESVAYSLAESQKHEGLGLRILDLYHDHLVKNPSYPLSFIPEASDVAIPAVELELRAPIINLKTGAVISNKYDILGHIDLVASTAGKTSIQDHKTSARKYADFKIKTSTQLLIYSYLYRYFFKEGRLKPKFKDTKPSAKEKSVIFNIFVKGKIPELQFGSSSVTDTDLERLYYIVENCEKIIDSGAFIPLNNMQCSYCDYNVKGKSICLEFQKSMKIQGNPKIQKIIENLEKDGAVLVGKR